MAVVNRVFVVQVRQAAGRTRLADCSVEFDVDYSGGVLQRDLDGCLCRRTCGCVRPGCHLRVAWWRIGCCHHEEGRNPYNTRVKRQKC